MQKLSIISYNLKNCSLTQRTIVQRAINGYKDYSYNRRYTYYRKGLVDILPNIYLNNGVIIVASKDMPKIRSVLKANRSQIKIIEVYSKKLLLH